MTETRASASPGRSFLRRPAKEHTAVDGVLETYRRMYPKEKTALIEQAYAVAKVAHEGQLRKSGEPYITHPIAVAQIIADLGLPDSVIAAALLHDVVEDTEHSIDQIREQFGDEVAMIVDGVTKLDKVKYGDAAQAETVRKMVVAMAKDIRVLLLKLCDRLAQRAHVGVRGARERSPQGAGDARDLRATRAPHGTQRDQVGARGSLV